MVDFGIRRLAPFENASRYHLFNDEGQLVLVADYQSPWLPVHAAGQVRFAKPDGSLVASLELPQGFPGNRRFSTEVSYAIIFDYAVYAIISEISPRAGDRPYFTLELEGKNWLALSSGEDESDYALYSNLPFGFNHQVQTATEDLPEPTGFIRKDEEGFDFVAIIPSSKLRQRALLSMAMIFLIDNLRDS